MSYFLSQTFFLAKVVRIYSRTLCIAKQDGCLHVRRCLEEVSPMIVKDGLRSINGKFLIRIH